MVLGSGGAGKSTLAKRIAEIAKLKLIHMDALYFEPNWVMRDTEDIIQRIVKSIVDEGWVFDGNHSATHELRAEKADIIIWVKTPRWRCILNVVYRAWKYRGQTRSDMPDGCIEAISWEFLKFIWDFKKRSWKIVKLLEDNKENKQTIILNNYTEIDAFVEKMKKDYG